MADRTQICNMALARIGGGDEQQRIVSFDDDEGSTVDWCIDFYPHCKKMVEERWGWISNSSFADLGAAVSGDSIPEAADWESVFNLPKDFAAMVKQTNEENHNQAFKYRVSGGKLFTNDLTNTAQTSAYIEYIKYENDAEAYSALMTEALVVLLASKLAGPIAKDDRFGLTLLEEYEVLALPNAKARNQASKADVNERGETSWLNARKGRGTTCASCRTSPCSCRWC